MQSPKSRTLRLHAPAALSGAWFVLGSDFAFVEGTYEATVGWSVVAIGLGLVGAVLGGLVTASIGRAVAPVKVLAGIVLVLGLVEAVMFQFDIGESEETEQAVAAEELPMWEAASKAQPPTWYSFTIPFIGCAGVVIGGRLKRGGGSSRPTGEVAPP